MTVQELINALNQIDNKELNVLIQWTDNRQVILDTVVIGECNYLTETVVLLS